MFCVFCFTTDNSRATDCFYILMKCIYDLNKTCHLTMWKFANPIRKFFLNTHKFLCDRLYYIIHVEPDLLRWPPIIRELKLFILLRNHIRLLQTNGKIRDSFSSRNRICQQPISLIAFSALVLKSLTINCREAYLPRIALRICCILSMVPILHKRSCWEM